MSPIQNDNIINIMVDLETLGTDHDAHILTIGAVAFTPAGILPEHQFYGRINPELKQFGRRIDPKTVQWWDTQDPAVREEAMGGMLNIVSILDSFFQGLKEVRSIYPSYKFQIWANAPTFDLCILRHAAEELGMEVPWSFREEMDYRTLKNLFPNFELQIAVDTILDKHNALHDARRQAVHTAWILHNINGAQYEHAARAA